MDCDKQIDLFVVIMDRKKKDEIVSLLMRSGGRVIHTIYGKGSVKANSVQDVFGFVPQENKIIATCLLQSKKSDALLDALNQEYHFDKPNTGFAFTVRIGGLSY